MKLAKLLLGLVADRRGRRRAGRACAEGPQVHPLPAREGGPAEACGGARVQGARREGDQRLDQGRDLSGRPVRQGPADHGRSQARHARARRRARRGDRDHVQADRHASGIPFLSRTTNMPGACDGSDREGVLRRHDARRPASACSASPTTACGTSPTAKKPIQSPADMKGMKIRIQPSARVHRRWWSLGASAVRDPWAELPTALQQKVGRRTGERRDEHPRGEPLPEPEVRDPGRPRLARSTRIWSTSASTNPSRPTEKKAVDEGAAKAIEIHRKMTSEQDKNAKQILEKVGMQVYTPTGAQIGEFKKLAQPPVRSGRRRRSARTTSTACSRRSTPRRSEPAGRDSGHRHRRARRADDRVQPDARRTIRALPAGLRRRHVEHGDRRGARPARAPRYVTRVGDDAFGRMFVALWAREGVDTARRGGRRRRGARACTSSPTVRRAMSSPICARGRRRAACAPRTCRSTSSASARFVHVSGISQAISASRVRRRVRGDRRGRAARRAQISLRSEPAAQAVAARACARDRSGAAGAMPTGASRASTTRGACGSTTPRCAIVDWAHRARRAQVVVLKLGAEGCIVR